MDTQLTQRLKKGTKMDIEQKMCQKMDTAKKLPKMDTELKNDQKMYHKLTFN